MHIPHQENVLIASTILKPNKDNRFKVNYVMYLEHATTR